MGRFKIRYLPVQYPAQGTEPFYIVHIVAMVADPAHTGNGGTVFVPNGDHDIIGDRENIGNDTIGI